MSHTVRRYHSHARLHLDEYCAWLRVFATLDLHPTDPGTRDWSGVLTFERLSPQDDSFERLTLESSTVNLSLLHRDPHLELFTEPAARDSQLVRLVLVPCQVSSVTLTSQRVYISVHDRQTDQSLSVALADHYNRETSRGADSAD